LSPWGKKLPLPETLAKSRFTDCLIAAEKLDSAAQISKEVHFS